MLTYIDIDINIDIETTDRQIDRYGISKNGTDEPVCRPGIEMQMQSMDSWIQCGKEGVEQVERVALTYTHYRV